MCIRDRISSTFNPVSKKKKKRWGIRELTSPSLHPLLCALCSPANMAASPTSATIQQDLCPTVASCPGLVPGTQPGCQTSQWMKSSSQPPPLIQMCPESNRCWVHVGMSSISLTLCNISAVRQKLLIFSLSKLFYSVQSVNKNYCDAKCDHFMS